jgi:hypothetical protein
VKTDPYLGISHSKILSTGDKKNLLKVRGHRIRGREYKGLSGRLGLKLPKATLEVEDNRAISLKF